jgi:hypothetical protein
MRAYRGVVKDNIVVLPEGVELADGQRVEVRVIPNGESTGDESPKQADPEEEIQRHLFELGLLSEIKRPSRMEPPGDRRPIKVRGKPVSEMIIEERR